MGKLTKGNLKMNLTLIGMPGAGKSLVGKEVAYRLNLQLIDTDELIRQQTGLTIGENLARLGDELFIQLEEQVVLQLGNFDNCVVSPGGSVIYSPKAMDFLKRRSFFIFLDVPLEVILDRVEPQRGVVKLRDRTLKDLFNERLPLYEQYADQTIFANRDLCLVVDEIVEIIKVLEDEPGYGPQNPS
jgi:shikimate kinase